MSGWSVLQHHARVLESSISGQREFSIAMHFYDPFICSYTLNIKYTLSGCHRTRTIYRTSGAATTHAPFTVRLALQPHTQYLPYVWRCHRTCTIYHTSGAATTHAKFTIRLALQPHTQYLPYVWRCHHTRTISRTSGAATTHAPFTARVPPCYVWTIALDVAARIAPKARTARDETQLVHSLDTGSELLYCTQTSLPQS